MDELELALRDAIERMYKVFAKYPLNDTTDPCSHCYPDTWAAEAPLHARPLRELSVSDLETYCSSALYTWGDADDFRHFLPRILELFVEEGFVYPDFEAFIDKLPYTKWQTWPDDEQAGVAEFLLAWWRWLVTSPAKDGEYRQELPDCLCGIGQVTDDIAPFLQIWRGSPTYGAVMELARFVMWNGDELREGRVSNAFWSNQRTMQQFVTWLREPDTQRLFALVTPLDEEDEEDMQRAVEMLSTLPAG